MRPFLAQLQRGIAVASRHCLHRKHSRGWQPQPRQFPKPLKLALSFGVRALVPGRDFHCRIVKLPLRVPGIQPQRLREFRHRPVRMPRHCSQPPDYLMVTRVVAI